MAKFRIIRDLDDMDKANRTLATLKRPFVLSWRDGDARSIPQNSLLHMWFGQIAGHFGDRTAVDVKGECHASMGLPIRLTDLTFAWVWDRTGALLPREKQETLLASGALGLSSGMTTPQLRQYLDMIEQKYRPMGVSLTDPSKRAA